MVVYEIGRKYTELIVPHLQPVGYLATPGVPSLRGTVPEGVLKELNGDVVHAPVHLHTQTERGDGLLSVVGDPMERVMRELTPEMERQGLGMHSGRL